MDLIGGKGTGLIAENTWFPCGVSALGERLHIYYYQSSHQSPKITFVNTPPVGSVAGAQLRLNLTAH